MIVLFCSFVLPDTNECLSDNGGCASACFNTYGGFECGCVFIAPIAFLRLSGIMYYLSMYVDPPLSYIPPHSYR